MRTQKHTYLEKGKGKKKKKKNQPRKKPKSSCICCVCYKCPRRNYAANWRASAAQSARRRSGDALLATALPDSGKQRLEDVSGQCLKTIALKNADVCVLLFLKM